MHYNYYLVFIDNDCAGVVYVPTIVNACVHRAGDSFSLNVRWRVCPHLHVFLYTCKN